MPSYKLIYFDVRGRGEAIRMLFALAGQKYEDVRIKAEQWPEEKTKIPLGQLPVVEVDGKQLLQTKAIASYLAREFGFYGANSWETAKIDEISGVVEDVWLPLVEIMYGKGDEAEKRDKMKAHFEGKAATMFQYLEDQLCKNKEGLGFFVGNKISLADLNFHTSMETIEKIDFPNKGLEKYPKLTALQARISADKALASYLEKRPKSDI